MTRRSALRSLAIGCGVLAPRPRGAVRGFDDAAAIRPRVEDEFAPLKAAIVTDASNAIDIGEEILQIWEEKGFLEKHPETGLISCERVVREISRFRRLLADFGVEILAPTLVEDAYCQVFTRDPSFVINKALYLARPADDHRLRERDGLKKIRARCETVVDLDKGDVLIEGGDVFVLDGGRRVLVGTNANSNAAGFRALELDLKARGVEVIEVPHRMLHLDCCLAPLPDKSALFHPPGLPKASAEILKKVFRGLTPLDKGEATRELASNLLWLDPENVVSGKYAPRTNAKLRALGYKVHAIEFTHVKRMWGSFRCATCPVVRG